MTTLLAIAGSYRDQGVIDQSVDVAVQAARRAGVRVDVVQLRDFPIGFCRNCRECTQAPGEAPGHCVQQDRMQELIRKIEAADSLILASPTNFFSVTALFKRFMERLLVYTYWPWGMHAPRFRKKRQKRALVIASAAAPAFMGRLFYSTTAQLKRAAKTMGARPLAQVFVGLASGTPQTQISERDKRRIERAVLKLVS